MIRTRRDQLHRAFRKYRAIRMVTNTLGAEERAWLDREIAEFEGIPSFIVRGNRPNILSELRKVTDRFGVVASLEQLEGLLAQEKNIRHLGPNTFLCVSKYHLLRLFTAYHRALPHFADMPQHARIGIDVYSIRDVVTDVEVYQLEASLFEDMAVLWNDCCHTNENTASSPKAPKLNVKLGGALMRATVKAAFNLLEGFLNGLACDILLLKKVTPDERMLLQEWDESRDRFKFVSLRDKILQYPRIAVGAVHPPIQESQFPQAGRIVELETHLRHALIHPRPQVNPDDIHAFREGAYFEIQRPRVASLVDDTIELIFKIADVVGPKYSDASAWLAKRGKDGLFEQKVFF